jgi:MFS family permease
VLAAVAGGAGLVGLVAFIAAPRSATAVLIFTGLYGGLAYTLYSIAVAHSNDHASAEDFVKVSSGLLLLYGFGTMVGPLIGAALMGRLRPESIFLATALAHLGITAYTGLRIRRRAPVPDADKGAFQTLPAERLATPEAIRLDPRSEAADA